MKTEPLDSLKTAWNEPETDSFYKTEELLLKELSRQWENRSRKLRRKFIGEFGFYVLLYLAAIVIIIQASTNPISQFFGIKIVLLSLIFFTPVGISLYQSLAFLRNVDLSKPMGSFVTESIQRLKRSEQLYMRYSYLFSGFMIALLLTDEFFSSQTLALQLVVFTFIALFALLVKPYLRVAYSKEREHFEKLRKEMEEKI